MTVLNKTAQLLRDRPQYRNSDKLLLSTKKVFSCSICSTEFKDSPSRQRKFCSMSCYRVSNKANPNSGTFSKGHEPLLYGDNHWKWAGDKVGYSGVHKWIVNQLGQPKQCDDCGDTSERKYEWANISQEYKRDTSDWKRLCKPCHHKFDSISEKLWKTRKNNGTDKGYELAKKTHCKRGHEYNSDNTYYYKNVPFCRLCRDVREDKYESNR